MHHHHHPPMHDMGDMGWGGEAHYGSIWRARIDGDTSEGEIAQKPVEIGEKAPQSDVINYEPNGNVMDDVSFLITFFLYSFFYLFYKNTTRAIY